MLAWRRGSVASLPPHEQKVIGLNPVRGKVFRTLYIHCWMLDVTLLICVYLSDINVNRYFLKSKKLPLRRNTTLSDFQQLFFSFENQTCLANEYWWKSFSLKGIKAENWNSVTCYTIAKRRQWPRERQPMSAAVTITEKTFISQKSVWCGAKKLERLKWEHNFIISSFSRFWVEKNCHNIWNWWWRLPVDLKLPQPDFQ
jgi:hypothetical protein